MVAKTSTKSQEKTERFQKGELMKKILFGIGVGLVIGAVFTMPGIVLAFKPFLQNKRISQQSFRKAYTTLEHKKLLKIRQKGGRYVVQLTEEGKRRQKELQLRDSLGSLKIRIPKIWDGKWWLIIFDIPESKKRAREALRRFLKHFGFYRLQDSVFIHPFDCEDELRLLVEFFEIKECVYCFTIDEEKVPFIVRQHFAKLLSRRQA